MSAVKAICLTLIFGVLSVIVVVGGAILGALLAMLMPIVLVFTGLWTVWWVTKDYDDDESDSAGT
jgi:hypothetical protein